VHRDGGVAVNVAAPSVALPSIAADLRLSFTSRQWVLSSYALVLANLLLAGGALGDRFGRRRLFLAGLGVFAVGSAVAALAGSGAVGIVGRSVQGTGCGSDVSRRAGAPRTSRAGEIRTLEPLARPTVFETFPWSAPAHFALTPGEHRSSRAPTGHRTPNPKSRCGPRSSRSKWP
jgi:MFS family permease